jgi:hypothetical protein
MATTYGFYTASPLEYEIVIEASPNVVSTCLPTSLAAGEVIVTTYAPDSMVLGNIVTPDNTGVLLLGADVPGMTIEVKAQGTAAALAVVSRYGTNNYGYVVAASEETTPLVMAYPTGAIVTLGVEAQGNVPRMLLF